MKGFLLYSVTIFLGFVLSIFAYPQNPINDPLSPDIVTKPLPTPDKKGNLKYALPDDVNKILEEKINKENNYCYKGVLSSINDSSYLFELYQYLCRKKKFRNITKSFYTNRIIQVKDIIIPLYFCEDFLFSYFKYSIFHNQITSIYFTYDRKNYRWIIITN
jgi:hypothetical protein